MTELDLSPEKYRLQNYERNSFLKNDWLNAAQNLPYILAEVVLKEKKNFRVRKKLEKIKFTYLLPGYLFVNAGERASKKKGLGGKFLSVETELACGESQPLFGL